MSQSYVHPETLKKAKSLLNRAIPAPDTPEWDDFLYELEESDDEALRGLADELNNNIIFSGVGDPKEKQVKAARRNQVQQTWLHALFYRRGEDGKRALNKLKVSSLISAACLTIFTVGFLANRLGLFPRANAASVTAAATLAPEPIPVEEESPFSVSVPPFERVTPESVLVQAETIPGTAPEPTSEPTPEAAPEPAPETRPSPAPNTSTAQGTEEEPVIEVTRGEKVPGGTILRSPKEEGENVNLVSSKSDGGIISRSSNKTSGSITSSHGEGGSSIASSGESGSVAGGSSPTVSTGGTESEENAEVSASDKQTSPNLEEDTATPTPETSAAQELPEAEAGEELQGFEAALQKAREDLAGREPVSEPVTYGVGDMLNGSLVFGVLTTGEDELPVLVMDENNVMWRGTAKLNALARVEVSLTHYIQNGAETPKTATVLDTDSYPGIKATMREAAPTLAADMIQASLKGVTDYVRDLASNRTTTLLEDQVIVQDQVVPLEWAIAGSLTELFTPPQPSQALVRVGEVPVATLVKIMILQ
jgi:hypothetical protein